MKENIFLRGKNIFENWEYVYMLFYSHIWYTVMHIKKVHVVK